MSREVAFGNNGHVATSRWWSARAENQEWLLDFVHDVVECGRKIRVLSVEDAYTRECLALEVDTSFASRRSLNSRKFRISVHG